MDTNNTTSQILQKADKAIVEAEELLERIKRESHDTAVKNKKDQQEIDKRIEEIVTATDAEAENLIRILE